MATDKRLDCASLPGSKTTVTGQQPLKTSTMVKIFSLSVVLAPPSGSCTVLSNATDLSSFSFYQRGSVGEFMTFLSRTVAERTPQGQRQSVQENNYVAHVYNRGGAEQLAGTHSHQDEPCIPLTVLDSCDHHRPRVSCSTCLLTAHKDSGRLHCQSPTILVLQSIGHQLL